MLFGSAHTQRSCGSWSGGGDGTAAVRGVSGAAIPVTVADPPSGTSPGGRLLRRAAAANVAATIAATATIMAATAALRLETEDIDGASRRCVLFDLFHCANDSQSGLGIVDGDRRKGDGAHPAADSRVDGH